MPVFRRLSAAELAAWSNAGGEAQGLGRRWQQETKDGARHKAELDPPAPLLELTASVREALHSTKYVRGLTHSFYRYPARFSPEFAREVIREFSAPYDLILDPFMGGGTTIVEALAAGRRAIGVDVNPLAHFVTDVKTYPLTFADADALRTWVSTPVKGAREINAAADDARTLNFPPSLRFGLAPYLERALGLRPARRARFARCALLRAGQWAAEAHRIPPSPDEVIEYLVSLVDEMLSGLSAFVVAAGEAGFSRRDLRRERRLVLTSTARRYWLQGVRSVGVPSLVLTSPPYPGVHVLYHRWQVGGRRETPAPYWLADLQDGHYGAHYTFGSRTPFGMKTYFEGIQRSFTAIRQVIGPRTMVAQLIAFSNRETQLPTYLAAMEAAGFQLVSSPLELAGQAAAATRTVPHRRWYAQVQSPDSSFGAAKEVLLLHRPTQS